MAFSRRFSALNGTAVLIGLLAGLAAVVFRGAINFVEELAFRGNFEWDPGEDTAFLTSPWGLAVILVPVAGGLIIGAVRYFFPETRRQGISEVMAAVQARGGIIRGRTAWGHAFISAVTLGTGGSSGREGPIGYVGAALGSSFGRRFGFRQRDIKVLLGCGTAAGIAATFNAPLGGVLFAMELILPEFSTHAFIPVVIATVVGVTVGQFFLGNQPSFLVPEFEFVSPWELSFYLILGVLCGLGGVLFIRTLEKAQATSDRLPMPYWAKPAFGGLLVGLLGLLMLNLSGLDAFGGTGQYHIFGTGYPTVNAILQGNAGVLSLSLLLALIIVKPLASSITLGSGGGGGVFSASLFQGALYGGLLGLVVNAFAPGVTAPASAYALVGMGAFYAAAGRATLTTIVLLTELTDGYAIVLPIMFAAVTADAVSVGLSRDSIYSVRLEKKGIHFEHDRTVSPLDTIQVREVMCCDVDCLPEDMEVGEAFNRMIDMGHNGFPVVDDKGRLSGVVTRRDISRHMHEGRGTEELGAIVSGLLITTFPEEYLHRARDRIFEQDIGRLLVVDPKDRRTLLGIVTRSDILRAEAEKDVEHTDMWTRGRGGDDSHVGVLGDDRNKD